MSRELHPIKYTIGHITLSLASFTQVRIILFQKEIYFFEST